MKDVISKLTQGNTFFRMYGDIAKRNETAANGQHPYAIVISCSDSRVIPEVIFHAGIGELFVIRIAGNVLGSHALASVEYAVEHLGCKEIVVLGHTSCGAVHAALSGEAEGLTADLIAEIRIAIGDETDPLQACEKNVRYGTERIRSFFSNHPGMKGIVVRGAVYEIETGIVRWMQTDINRCS
jgi:carbonic anhydrase